MQVFLERERIKARNTLYNPPEFYFSTVALEKRVSVVLLEREGERVRG
jgi:hypothetical protein